MKYSKLTYYLLTILCMMATSCVTDGVMDECPDSSKNTEMVTDACVSLVLNFAINSSATRAGEIDGSTIDGELNERKIKDVHIYAFQNNKFKEEVKYVSIFGTDGDKTRIIQGTLSEKYNPEIAVKFVVIANGENKKVITPNIPKLDSNTTPETLFSQLVFDYNSNDNWNTCIPMAGICEIKPLQEGDYNTAELQLTRAIAKVNVTVNEGKGLEGVEITEITLHNYNTQGYCAVQENNNLPYIPATSQISTSTLSSGPLRGKEGNCFENHFYIPEHKNIGIAEDNRVYLHIKANVYDMPKEYDLAFTHNGNIHDVLRNYIYIFNIKSIKAQDASLSLDYTVKKWDLISVDVPSFN